MGCYNVILLWLQLTVGASNQAVICKFYKMILTVVSLQGGNTPLHIAAYKGNCQCVAMLLESKSDPSAQNEV